MQTFLKLSTIFLVIKLVKSISIYEDQESKNDNLKKLLFTRLRSNNGYETAVLDLISRIIPELSNRFVVNIDADLNKNDSLIDTFELEMIENNEKLLIRGNTAVAATWGFNYYLKYYCNSSINWSGRNINLKDKLPIVENKIRIEANDYIRFYQNVCTYSYSYVWWNWTRWEQEIDWSALNGINLVYAHTAAEYAYLNVLLKLGFTQEEVNDFFTGPAYLAWFRMGNLKRFGGHLTPNWHVDQVALLKRILKRYDDLGIKYVLPAFAGFVPDNITRLFPSNNFTISTNWIDFGCNFSCSLMVNPMDPLFQTIGKAFINEITENFGTAHFYSADVFNEMVPKSNDSTYLAAVNAAIFKSIQSEDDKAVWVMQAWLFNDPFWTEQNVKAFLSEIPLGSLVVLDLWAEEMPHYKRFESFYGHYFVWNMLHDFGGANGIFGVLSSVNEGPEMARRFPNSTMIGIGITMEGINQNEFIYEFMLEKAWRPTLDDIQINDFIRNFIQRRYLTERISQINDNLITSWVIISKVLYDIDDYQNKQLFTRRPSLELIPEKIENEDEFFNAWNLFVDNSFSNGSTLFKYDLVDLTKEALRLIFNKHYVHLVESYNEKQLISFNYHADKLIGILIDMDDLLASDHRFLLGNWLESAKSKATNQFELALYEWNARNQITLWGTNSSQIVFDYACKAWSGLVKDYYLARWLVFFQIANESLVENAPINTTYLDEHLLVDAETKFIQSTRSYPTIETGDSYFKSKELNKKYRF